jgi:hypothetical protein
MCRPSCCKPRSQAPGVVAVAVVIGAGIVAGKVGHVLARIVHDTINVLLLIALGAGAAAAVAIAAWVMTGLVCWWLRRQKAQQGRVRSIISQFRPARSERVCLACGGAGEVLRGNGAGGFEPRACPECQPARLAG